MSIALAILGFFAIVWAANLYFPPKWPVWLAFPAFWTGWLIGELALHSAAIIGGGAVALAVLGGLADWYGTVGLVLALVAVAIMLLSWRGAGATRQAGEAVLGKALVAPKFGWRLIWPFKIVRRGAVAITRDVKVDPDAPESQVVDVFAPRSGARHAPVLVYVHGGGWVSGFRSFQGLPLFDRLVNAGWVCVSAEYRLSPVATFPAHIIDVKRAIAWVRANIADYGGDPDAIYISGNSAGGHLSALAALTPNDPAWQPGFEDVDTSVRAAAPCYGIYDLLHRESQWPHKGLRLLWRWLVLRKPFTDVDAWKEASPWDHVGADAPPFLIVHGANDSLVPVAEARRFHDHFERLVPGRAKLFVVPGAQHAFDVFLSRRSIWGVETIATYLQDHWSQDRGSGRS